MNSFSYNITYEEWGKERINLDCNTDQITKKYKINVLKIFTKMFWKHFIIKINIPYIPAYNGHFSNKKIDQNIQEYIQGIYTPSIKMKD